MTDSVTADLGKQVAVMESELQHVRQDVEKIERRLERMEAVQVEIRDFMSKARGGWMALGAAAVAGGTVVGAILKFIPWPH